MEIFILEDMNELEAARVMIGGLLESGKVHDPAEVRFLRQRLRGAGAPLGSKVKSVRQLTHLSAIRQQTRICMLCPCLLKLVMAQSLQTRGFTQAGEEFMKRKKTQGFTLVEIAIVLVIIGLLLGGILKGQEMITQAKIKNVIADFSGISAAYHGYVDRYKRIPGDDPCAGAAVPSRRDLRHDHRRWTGATHGNGNGVVAGKYNTATATDESRLWWDHLRRAGFVSGVGDNQPYNASPARSACRPATPPARGALAASPASSCARRTCRTRSPSPWTRRWTTAFPTRARCAP